MSEERFDRIDQRLDRLETGVAELKADVGELKADVGRLKGDVLRLDGRVVDLGRHMRVLHEEAMAAIAATREYSGPTKAEFAELRAMLSQRLDPLEATVRFHGREIDGLKKRRP